MPDYSKKTVAELTEILKSRSLPHTGKKADLVARLNEADQAAQTTEEIETPVVEEAAPAAAQAVEEVTAPEPATGTATAQPATDASQPAPPSADPAPSPSASATTDAKLANDAQYSLGLNQSSVDDELERRKKRAARFNIEAPTGETNGNAESEASKALERAKRFGTGQTSSTSSLSKLDEALSTDRKRGRPTENGNSLTDLGLKRGKSGGFRHRGGQVGRGGRGGRNDSRGRRPEGVKKSTSGLNEADRTAADARKKRWQT